MKPILFTTDMVRAIQDDRKTATRRLVKPQPDTMFPYCHEEDTGWHWTTSDGDDDMMGWYPSFEKGVKPPYQSGDILYVRETWAVERVYGNNGIFGFDCVYKADNKILSITTKDWDKYCQWGKFFDKNGWISSIHMSKEAARLFLRVTDVRAERLRDITPEQAVEEGAVKKPHYMRFGGEKCLAIHSRYKKDFSHVWDNCYAKPQPVKKNDKIVRYESYPWEDIRETRTYRGLPWLVIGNPWVWVIEFEKISKKEIE